MMLTDEAHYVISGFGPPNKDSRGLGKWGFAIGLKGEFARRCLEHKITEENVKRFNEIGKAILANGFADEEFRDPYHFYDEDGEYRLLLRWVTVPGNACDLGSSGVTEKEIRKYGDRLLEYDQHNIDTMQQACMLLTMFLNWHDFAVAILSNSNGTTKGT